MYCEDCFFFQAEDGIRDLVRSRGLGDVYKRQGAQSLPATCFPTAALLAATWNGDLLHEMGQALALSLIHI